MGEIDNMTLYELLQYADKELDIVIKEVSRANALERKMETEAKKSYPKGATTIQEYIEYIKGWGIENPKAYSIGYDYIRDEIIIVIEGFSFINFKQGPLFVNLDSISKFRDENKDELRWYFKYYKRLI